MAETLNTRVTRLEKTMEEIAGTTKILLDAQIKTEARFQETEVRFQEIRREADEREKRLDERIEKLVSAIGELIARSNGRERGVK
jgi:predicted  nucleic acid-binding Zn-ribbon protein